LELALLEELIPFALEEALRMSFTLKVLGVKLQHLC
jgi:hypothetical protein